MPVGEHININYHNLTRNGLAKLNTNVAKRKNLSVSACTKAALDRIRHQGQSYEGLIRELVECWEKQNSRS